MASTTSGPVRMLPWMAYAVSPSSRATPPAQSLHSEPVKRRGAADPDDADLAGLAALVERGGGGERRVGRLPRGEPPEQLVEVGDPGVRLRCDGARRPTRAAGTTAPTARNLLATATP